MRTTSKPQIAKPKVPAKPSVTPKPVSRSGERTKAAEVRTRNERSTREKAGGGIDSRHRLTEIEAASLRAHERSEEERRRGSAEAPVGQAGAKKSRPMYSISDPPSVR